jgi:hypothetical protein
VLDFVSEADTIKEAFEDFYETSSVRQLNPDRMLRPSKRMSSDNRNHLCSKWGQQQNPVFVAIPKLVLNYVNAQNGLSVDIRWRS